MEDWDWDGGNTNTEVEEKTSPEAHTEGKIFGNRGRGFAPAVKRYNSKVGREWAPKTEYCNTERNANFDDDNWEKENKPEKNQNSSEWNGRGRDRKGGKESDGLKKPKSIYIPQDPTENDEEIFGNGISSGINFKKYDDIEVKVSGENPSHPIHSFEDNRISSSIFDLIKKSGYSKPTPIQKYAIPIILDKRDLMACAQTGSGKTAAFLIPIINLLLEDKIGMDFNETCTPQAIIVSPTRELTIQIFNEARKFSRGTSLKVAILYGGTSVSYQTQNLLKGCHILVTTPGRLLDFIRRGKIKLSEIKFVVLDEADRMLDLGFLPDMESFLSHKTMVPSEKRQTCMFSATFPEEIQRLAGQFLNNYLFVAVGIVGGACSDVEQRFFSVAKFEKRRKLVELLNERGSERCLIFVEQKRTTDFIATYLCEKNFPATSIHGDREQREREEALKDFKSGKMVILVATSVAARGLDIKNVAHVVNFDLPNSIDEYVHRIGRTGRVGNRGLATSFYDPEKDRFLAGDLIKILSQAGQVIPDFLRDAGSGGGSGFGELSKFGGRDCRSQNPSYDLGSARETTFEEEVW